MSRGQSVSAVSPTEMTPDAGTEMARDVLLLMETTSRLPTEKRPVGDDKLCIGDGTMNGDGPNEDQL